MPEGFAARRTYALNFDEIEDLDGLRVKVRSTTVDVMIRVQETRADDGQGIREIAAHFVDALLEWNLEDETGVQVPHTVEACLQLVDREYLIEILRAWQRAVIGIQAPLRRRSPAGEQSRVELPPTAPLSESQAS